MFYSINLCGAEINTEFSEQHRAHLLFLYNIKVIVSIFPLVVKSEKLSDFSLHSKNEIKYY